MTPFLFTSPPAQLLFFLLKFAFWFKLLGRRRVENMELWRQSWLLRSRHSGSCLPLWTSGEAVPPWGWAASWEDTPQTSHAIRVSPKGSCAKQIIGAPPLGQRALWHSAPTLGVWQVCSVWESCLLSRPWLSSWSQAPAMIFLLLTTNPPPSFLPDQSLHHPLCTSSSVLLPKPLSPFVNMFRNSHFFSNHSSAINQRSIWQVFFSQHRYRYTG